MDGIDRIQSGRPVQGVETLSLAEAMEQAAMPKPLLGDNLSITTGAYRAPGEVEALSHAEEPARDDPIARKLLEAFDLQPPDMPNFV